jgi:hypothetical protein
VRGVFLALALLGFAAGARAEDEMPTFKIVMHEGTITPSSVEVPANTRFKLEIENTGDSPVEFESLELKRERVLAGKTSTYIIFRRLDPGSYPFFDDFHPEAKATLVAK